MGLSAVAVNLQRIKGRMIESLKEEEAHSPRQDLNLKKNDFIEGDGLRGERTLQQLRRVRYDWVLL
jgi:hypothetical protein